MPVGQPERPWLSFSGARTLAECQRQWILYDAPDYLPEEMRWPARQQKKLAPWPTFAGKVVDEAINVSLRQYRDSGAWPEDLIELAFEQGRMAHENSAGWARAVHRRSGKWPPTAPFQPLDRHYYREPISGEERAHLRDTVRLCMSNFASSEAKQFIEETSLEYWLGPSEGAVPWFQVGPASVWVSLDFAIRTPDTTYILDWKSGRRSALARQNADQQLLWYALYANLEWGIPVEEIQVASVWLAEGGDLRFQSVDPHSLKCLAEDIEACYWDLKARLGMIATEGLSLDEWPLTEQTRLCASCRFRGVCAGARRLGQALDAAPVGGMANAE